MQAADRIPEEKIFTNECWSLILGEILTGMKPYLDIETDVMMEEFVFKCKRESKETMSSYVTRKMNEHRDLQQAMGKKQVVCPHCHGDFTINNDFPDEFLAHLWKKDAQLSDDNMSQERVHDVCMWCVCVWCMCVCFCVRASFLLCLCGV